VGIFKHIQSEVEAREELEGITAADLLDLSPVLSRLMAYITRTGEVSVETVAEYLGESAADAGEMLNTMVEKGYLEREERQREWFYRTRFGRKRGRDVPPGIWSALGGRTQE
jgi:DNA-binding MarR family transcriptional regulator